MFTPLATPLFEVSDNSCASLVHYNFSNADSDRDEADANEYEDNAQAITRVLRGNEVSCQLKYQELIDYASRQTGKPSYQLRLQQVKFEFTETELFPVQVELWVSWGETPETSLILTAKVSLP